MDYSPLGSSVHGILQEPVAMPSSKESSEPGIEPGSLASPKPTGGFFTAGLLGIPKVAVVSTGFGAEDLSRVRRLW